VVPDPLVVLSHMTELRERIAVQCPAVDADAGVAAFFSAREDADGTTRMRLRVPVPGAALALDREVRVEARKARDEENLNDLMRVSWRAESTVIFPSFEGTLVTYGADDGKGSYVELRGNYEAPLGAAGQIFDEAIGFQIAQRTAREFLRDIKRDMEARIAFKRRVNGD
jgi:hypothetical protein